MPSPIITRRLLSGGGGGGGGGGGKQGLFLGLESNWSLDELGPGGRADSTLTNALTDNLNNVGHDNSGGVACTPIIGHCAGSFGATGNTNTGLIHADNASLGIGTGKSFTMTGWFFANSGSAASHAAGKWSGTAGLQDYALYVGQAPDSFYYFNFTAFNLANTQITLSPNSSAFRIGGSAWKFLAWGYDDVAQQLWFQGGAPSPGVLGTYKGSAAACVGVRRTACNFIVGGLQAGGLAFWGSIDEVSFWSRTLSAAEVTQVWNNGLGLAYANYS